MHFKPPDALSRVEILREIEDAERRQQAMLNLRHAHLVKVIAWESEQALQMLDEAGLPRPRWVSE